jgi:hypothetical protein
MQQFLDNNQFRGRVGFGAAQDRHRDRGRRAARRLADLAWIFAKAFGSGYPRRVGFSLMRGPSEPGTIDALTSTNLGPAVPERGRLGRFYPKSSDGLVNPSERQRPEKNGSAWSDHLTRWNPRRDVSSYCGLAALTGAELSPYSTHRVGCARGTGDTGQNRQSDQGGENGLHSRSPLYLWVCLTLDNVRGAPALCCDTRHTVMRSTGAI